MPLPPLQFYQKGPLNPKDIIIGSKTVDDPSMLGIPPFIYTQRGNGFKSYLQETINVNNDDDTSVRVDGIFEAYSPEKFYSGNSVSAYAHFQGDFLLRCGGRELA